MEKHTSSFVTGNAQMIETALGFYNPATLKSMEKEGKHAELHELLQALKRALTRDTVTCEQKIKILDVYVHHTPIDLARTVVCQYLQCCGKEQQSKVMKILEDIPALYDDPHIHDILPFAPTALPTIVSDAMLLETAKNACTCQDSHHAIALMNQIQCYISQHDVGLVILRQVRQMFNQHMQALPAELKPALHRPIERVVRSIPIK